MVYSPARRVAVRVCPYYGEGDRYDFPFYPDRVFFWGSDHAGDDPFPETGEMCYYLIFQK